MVGKALAKISGRIYLALIFIFLYAPIATLIVLSFNESRFRGKWGGFSLKWYESLFSSRNYGCTLDDAFIGVFVRVDRDDPRNDGIFCHEPYEKTAAHDLDDGDQYSDAQCRYCNRNLLDAFIYRTALPDGIRQCADRAYYIQSALCGAECTSEIKADE